MNYAREILVFIPKMGNFGADLTNDLGVIVPVLVSYLAANKRLVVPQLGSFIVKNGGESILFSELLRKDDGQLRGLLVERGLSELEAAGEIDRFVFEVRHAMERGEAFPMEGFGLFFAGGNGTIAFRYTPQPVAVEAVEEVEAVPTAEPVTAPVTESVEVLPAESVEEPTPEPVVEPAPEPEPTLESAPESEAVPEPIEGESAPAQHHVEADRVAEAMRSAFAAHDARADKHRPDPSLRGLRYGKPGKNSNSYGYAERGSTSSFDRIFLWVAVIVALLVLGVIAVVKWQEHQQERMEQEYLMEEPMPAEEMIPLEGE